ncbi:MAG: glycosyltransferase family 39 protein [Thermoanaerobaculia bacterium]
MALLRRPTGRAWLLALAWAVASSSFVWMIDWGTPRPSWARLVEWYEPIAAAELESSRADAQSNDTRDWRASHTRSVLGLANSLRADPGAGRASRLTRAEQAETVEKYLLGSKGYDESATISAIKRMVSEGKYFDPKDYRYGGSHLYLVAASLAGGTVLGLVPNRVDFETLKRDQSGIRALYGFARLPSAVAMSLALAALMWVVARQFGHWTALYGGFLVACSPLVVNYTHSMKPPAVAAAYATGALAGLWLAQRTGRRPWLTTSAALAGLAVGSYFSSGPILLLPAAYVAFGDGEPWLERFGTILKYVVAPALLAFLITNPFVATNPSGYAETFVDVTIVKSGYYSFNAGYQNLRDLSSGLLQGMGLAVTLLSALGLAVALRGGDRLERAAAVTVLAAAAVFTFFFGGATKDPMLGGVSRYLLYLIGPMVYLASFAIARSARGNRSRFWLPVACCALLLPALLTTAESFAGLREEIHDGAEAQVLDYLADNELQGRRGAVALAVPRPHRQVAFPVLGIEWHRFAERDQWSDEERPELLLLSLPLAWFEWEHAQKYRAAAAFGVERSRFHERFSFPCKWFDRTYLYVLKS